MAVDLGFLAMAETGMFTPVPLQALEGGGGARRGRKEERIPQWSFGETRELIGIRAELERDFTQTKRNKTLWELIAGKMRDKGFRRSADQCKCKWKNLVNRYKGKELSDPENGRQCPFFDELDAIFKARLSNVGAKLLLESDGAAALRPRKNSSKSNLHRRKKQQRGMESEEEASEEEEEEDEGVESEDDQRVAQKRKRKADKERQRATAEKCRASNMQEVLEGFVQQQQQMEEQWRASAERRERERRGREREWRERMERWERERSAREQAWWEQEELRRSEDEARSLKRDELLTALVMRLAHHNVHSSSANAPT